MSNEVSEDATKVSAPEAAATEAKPVVDAAGDKATEAGSNAAAEANEQDKREASEVANDAPRASLRSESNGQEQEPEEPADSCVKSADHQANVAAAAGKRDHAEQVTVSSDHSHIIEENDEDKSSQLTGDVSHVSVITIDDNGKDVTIQSAAIDDTSLDDSDELANNAAKEVIIVQSSGNASHNFNHVNSSSALSDADSLTTTTESSSESSFVGGGRGESGGLRGELSLVLFCVRACVCVSD